MPWHDGNPKKKYWPQDVNKANTTGSMWLNVVVVTQISIAKLPGRPLTSQSRRAIKFYLGAFTSWELFGKSADKRKIISWTASRLCGRKYSRFYRVNRVIYLIINNTTTHDKVQTKGEKKISPKSWNFFMRFNQIEGTIIPFFDALDFRNDPF